MKLIEIMRDEEGFFSLRQIFNTKNLIFRYINIYKSLKPLGNFYIFVDQQRIMFLFIVLSPEIINCKKCGLCVRYL